MRARNGGPAVHGEVTWLRGPPFPGPNLLPGPRPGGLRFRPMARAHADSAGRQLPRARTGHGAGAGAPGRGRRRSSPPSVRPSARPRVGPASVGGGGHPADLLGPHRGPEGAAGAEKVTQTRGGRASARARALHPLVPAGPAQPPAPPRGPPPAPRPGRSHTPRGLLCPPRTPQAREGRSGSPPASPGRPRLLPPGSPGARRTARGAGGARAPLRCAYLGRWRRARRRARRGLRREEASERRDQGGAARTAATRTRPDPAGPAQRAPPRGPPRDTARPAPGSWVRCRAARRAPGRGLAGLMRAGSGERGRDGRAGWAPRSLCGTFLRGGSRSFRSASRPRPLSPGTGCSGWHWAVGT